ncbi:hypothetical protein KIN20_036555 [Parelaphostrongylus tenuis]|uniref:Ima1 N-terminal domain-containing protein n=1 Tax=Parelaphostrongylus tenuis TaxID=148309 RepID=A0AAD5RGC4_PARTN|nr:hypothetical protein KIN20_036555 [Parelaphostrongylus tenuis]
MEAVLAVAACMVAPLVYRSLRKHVYTKVNCWFCQHDQRVPFEQRNSFVCASCEQYNGFDESGGYNRKIPGQHCLIALKPTKRFCASSAMSPTRPDVIPQEGGGGNGLCDNCNRQQEIILRRIAEFEPLDENKWNEEVEIYRYKLNKAYPLCAKCTFFAQDKMQQEKKRYADLIRLKNTVTKSILNGFTSAANAAVKIATKRRRFFAGGYITETMHCVTLVLSTLLFLSQFNFLQEDAELDFLQLPALLLIVTPTILSIAHHLVGVLFCAQLVSIWTNKCRVTLPDLLLPIMAAIHLASFAVPENMYREDLALFRCAFSSFETLLAATITFVPRKRKHRKRPNRILSSAFSIASTPMSQWSSQATSCNSSFTFQQNGGVKSEGISSLSGPDFTIRERFKWREREETPESRSPHQTRLVGDYEEMDWEPSLTGSNRVTSDASVGRSLRPSEVMKRMVRETTPTRELAPSLASLSLLGDSHKAGSSIGIEAGRRSPFRSPRSVYQSTTLLQLRLRNSL